MIANKVKILSTKRLTTPQSQLFNLPGFSLMEKDFIKISHQEFQLKTRPDLLLFTSQNAVYSILKNNQVEDLKAIPTLCVGVKTQRLLENHGFTVKQTENYAADLAKNMQVKNERIAFFCGNRRMETLPKKMDENQLSWEEYTVYKTVLNPHKINDKLDALLFFSPSGIRSYRQKNQITGEKCFCIGTTTAAVLPNLKEQIYISKEQTIEGTIKTCLAHFKTIVC